MILKDLLNVVLDDCIISVFVDMKMIENFTSRDKSKCKLYETAIVTGVMSLDNEIIGVSINM